MGGLAGEDVRASDHRRWKEAADSWEAWLRYRQGRFEEAARLQEGVAEQAPGVSPRTAALLGAASAWMEVGELARARDLARAALELARESRHLLAEARAEWLLRAVAYRAGDAAAPDLDLVRAAEHLGMPHLTALILLNEAAVAWRAGDEVAARPLADRAAGHWAALAQDGPRCLARALALACGAELKPESWRRTFP